MSVAVTELAGRRFALVEHAEQVGLGSLSRRLRGVTVAAPVPVIVGGSGGRAAVMGQLPELVSTQREVESFVQSLLKNRQIELGGAAAGAAAHAVARSETAVSGQAISRETHRVASAGAKKVLVRVRFQCQCGR